MKKILFLIAIVTSGILVQAQVYSMEDKRMVNLNETGINFVDVTTSMNWLQTKIKYFRIDYGQPMGMYGDKMTDVTGKPLNLKSVASMLDHFDKNGLDLINVHAVANSQTYMSHYIFKKRKE